MTRRREWQVIARHKWVSGTVITESFKVDDDLYRRFTATIRGWRNWRIWQGYTGCQATPETWTTERIRDAVKAIRNRIDAGDELVFNEPGFW